MRLQGLATAATCCWWRRLASSDLALLAACAAASVAASAWRRLRPASYAAWREWQTAATRVRRSFQQGRGGNAPPWFEAYCRSAPKHGRTTYPALLHLPTAGRPGGGARHLAPRQPGARLLGSL